MVKTDERRRSISQMWAPRQPREVLDRGDAPRWSEVAMPKLETVMNRQPQGVHEAPWGPNRQVPGVTDCGPRDASGEVSHLTDDLSGILVLICGHSLESVCGKPKGAITPVKERSCQAGITAIVFQTCMA